MKIYLHITLFILVLFSYTKIDSQWIRIYNSFPTGVWVKALASSNNILIAGTGHASTPSGVYISTNSGLNWQQTSLNNRDIESLSATNQYILAGTYPVYGIYRSSNNGNSWQHPLSSTVVEDIAISDPYVLIAVGNGVMLSTNSGLNWTSAGLTGGNIFSVSIRDNYLYAGKAMNGIWYSTNLGVMWTQSSLTDKTTYEIAYNNQCLIAGTYLHGIYKSTDNGITWYQTNVTSQSVVSIVNQGNNFIAATDSPYYIYWSSNNGDTWSVKNEGISVSYVYALAIFNNYVFAGTNQGIYRRSLSEFIGINNISNIEPDYYSLHQNYPNPFNPTTQIKFDLSKISYVKLNVYDVLGKEVAALVNEELKAGEYSVDWNAFNYPSGVYFYAIQAGYYSETKKMILIK